jgi:hypothetical protein
MTRAEQRSKREKARQARRDVEVIEAQMRGPRPSLAAEMPGPPNRAVPAFVRGPGNRALRRTLATVLLRDYPSGAGRSRPPAPIPAYAPRFAERNALILFAAGDADYVEGDRLGLAAALEVSGASVISGTIIVPDDVAPRTRALVKRRARTHLIDTLAGPKPWRVETETEFFEPGSKARPSGTFARRSYVGAWRCVGYDLIRTFGLLSEYRVECTGRKAGTWKVWPKEWGKRNAKGTMNPVTRHRPPKRITPRRCGTRVEFVWAPKGFGKVVKGRPWSGDFLDLHSAAYTLDGDKGATFAEHRENFGLLSPADLPVTVASNAAGVDAVTEAVISLHELALVLDGRGAEWFTTAEDRRSGRGHIALSEFASPGRLAAEILGRAGFEPPETVWALSDEESLQWAESFHGGWNWFLPGLRGSTFHAALGDISSAHPLSAVHLGWLDFVRAERIERTDDTEEFTRFIEKVAADPSIIDGAAIRRYGMNLVCVVPDGEPFPASTADPRYPDGRLDLVPLYAKGLPMYYVGADVMNAAAMCGRAPRIASSTHHRPIGRQRRIRRRLPVLPGLVWDTSTDIALSLVKHRRKLKAAGDFKRAALLRVVVNALVFGNPCRLDDVRMKIDGDWVIGEKPSTWTCFPLASAVAATTRLLVGLYCTQVSDLGGVVAYIGTDSAMVPASPDGGGELTLSDGTTYRELSWAELDAISADHNRRFAVVDDWPVWGVKRGTVEAPLHAVYFTTNHHAEFIVSDAGDGSVELVGLTESQLSGLYGEPATMAGRGADGVRVWAKAAVKEMVEFTLAREADPRALRRSGAVWDNGASMLFPALRRLTVTTPELLHTLPGALGARMGSRFIEGMRPPGYDQSVVALDPGGDLADWLDLRWLDRSTGARVWVTTDPMDIDAVCLATLGRRVHDWTRAPLGADIEAVEIDHVEHKGRVAGVLDAASAGLGKLASRRPVYDQLDADNVAALAKDMGPAAFSKRYSVPLNTAKDISSGRKRPGARTIKAVKAPRSSEPQRACALDGCTEPTLSPRAKYCGDLHKDKARRIRQAIEFGTISTRRKPRLSRVAAEPLSHICCAGPDCTRPARPRGLYCKETGEVCRKAAYRARQRDADDSWTANYKRCIACRNLMVDGPGKGSDDVCHPCLKVGRAGPPKFVCYVEDFDTLPKCRRCSSIIIAGPGKGSEDTCQECLNEDRRALVPK